MRRLPSRDNRSMQPMTKTPDPIQELVAAARRKQILDAATQVFAEIGRAHV